MRADGLDVGLINYQLGLHQEMLTIQDLHQSSKGKLVQQIVNQEIKSLDYLPGAKRAFWVREERGTSSEVDIVFPFQNMLIPIEVKSTFTGKNPPKSLLKFLKTYPDSLYGVILNKDRSEDWEHDGIKVKIRRFDELEDIFLQRNIIV